MATMEDGEPIKINPEELVQMLTFKLLHRLSAPEGRCAQMKDGEPSNWAELPPELLSSILLRLYVVDRLFAQMVCRSWRRVSKDPSMWQKIDLGNTTIFFREGMYRRVVDLSDGGLVETTINYGSDSLLAYLADRSSILRSLRVKKRHPISPEGFLKALVKLPLLESLDVPNLLLSGDSLKVAGQSCPNLKTLKLHRPLIGFAATDEDAIAIAESMPELRHLKLFGNTLTNRGLNAILDACPHLEQLDLRKCSYVDLSGNLEKLCLERIKDLRRPNDPSEEDLQDFFPPRSSSDSIEDSRVRFEEIVEKQTKLLLSKIILA